MVLSRVWKGKVMKLRMFQRHSIQPMVWCSTGVPSSRSLENALQQLQAPRTGFGNLCTRVWLHIRPPISASSLCSSHHHDLSLPCVRTTVLLLLTRSFPSILSIILESPLSFLRTSIVSTPLSLSLSHLKSYLSSGSKMHWKSLELYKYLYTIQCNMVC